MANAIVVSAVDESPQWPSQVRSSAEGTLPLRLSVSGRIIKTVSLGIVLVFVEIGVESSVLEGGSCRSGGDGQDLVSSGELGGPLKGESVSLSRRCRSEFADVVS